MGIGSIVGATGLGGGAPATAAKPGGGSFSKSLAAATGSKAAPAQLSPQQQYNQSLSDLQKTLSQLFGAAGVDPSHEIVLGQQSGGSISVLNDHPNLEQIEKVLKAHPELTSKFKAVSQALLQAQQAAGKPVVDPATATFALTLTGGQATAEFD